MEIEKYVWKCNTARFLKFYLKTRWPTMKFTEILKIVYLASLCCGKSYYLAFQNAIICLNLLRYQIWANSDVFWNKISAQGNGEPFHSNSNPFRHKACPTSTNAPSLARESRHVIFILTLKFLCRDILSPLSLSWGNGIMSMPQFHLSATCIAYFYVQISLRILASFEF